MTIHQHASPSGMAEKLTASFALTKPGTLQHPEADPTAEEQAWINALRERSNARSAKRFAAALGTAGPKANFALEPVMAMTSDGVRAASKATIGAWFGGEDEDPYDREGPLAVIEIIGPLMQYGGWFWDGYESIRSRFAAALNDPSVGAVALVINSPGGVCAGCFETARAMRKAAEASGKPVFSFSDESMYSAGYALGCVGKEIYLPEPGGVGSVGVIGVLYDQVKLNEELGFNVVVIASGDQKADGHPDAPLSEEAVKRYRDRTTSLANMFADLVGESRGMKTADVLALQAGCFYGRGAVTAGLADGVKTRDQFLAYAQREAKKALPSAASSARRAMNKTNEKAASGGDQPTEGTLLSIPSFSAIALALGINHSSDEGSIIARAKELQSFEGEVLKSTKAATRNDALGAITAGSVAIEQMAKVGPELAQLKLDAQRRDVDSLISEAKAAGKITNDDLEREMRELGAENPTRLKSTLSYLPIVVKASQPTQEPVATVQLTPEEREVAKQMGISEEALLKSKQASKLAAQDADDQEDS